MRGKDEARQHPAIAAKQQFALELDHFASCIRTNKQPYTPGEEGAQDMRIMEAIFQSARDGKRVELPRVERPTRSAARRLSRDDRAWSYGTGCA